MGIGRGGLVGSSLIELGVAQQGLQAESGDAYLMQPFPGGTLIAVVDGLGHGSEAAIAARAAVSALAADAGQSPETLLERCHAALKPTRGAVGSLASITATGTMSWVGVGNVQAALMRAGRSTRTLAARGGILGYDLPDVHGTEELIASGDLLVFATDGVRPESLAIADPRASAQANAERVLDLGCTGRDDALVLVARYQGQPL